MVFKDYGDVVEVVVEFEDVDVIRICWGGVGELMICMAWWFLNVVVMVLWVL